MPRIICLTFALGVFLCPAAAKAGPFVMAGDTVRLTDGAGTTGGGEFTIIVNDVWSFMTLCLQRTEYINFADTFDVDAVSAYALTDPADHGGDGSGRDYLSPHTAFLYTKFREGSLAGYSYDGPNHASSADQLQTAIWMFEQELPMDFANPFVVLASNTVNGGLWSGIGDVRALNLSRNGVEAQDQLALSPVPEPASLLLLGSGLLALGRRARALKG